MKMFKILWNAVDLTDKSLQKRQEFTERERFLTSLRTANIVKLLFAFLSSRESELLFAAESFVLVYDYNYERISKERNAIFQGIMRYK